MITISKDFKDQSAKVSKTGGTAKGNRLVKNRVKKELSENIVINTIDKKDQRANERKARRKRYNY